ncbi:MAG TPA: CRISPR-associated endonuclease Cas3'' [Dongiaceae bacterium]|jgi:CRISPR-associated endonuclease/helicase Cas3|nr:CRISPR-associated endonuclease Cas3'' [Dongiaceae bacterium]
MSEYLAHVNRNEDGTWAEHALEEHLRKVAVLAARFAAPFGGQQWSDLAGRWHDLGKYRPGFQGYIRKASGYDPDAHIEQGTGRVVHSEAGAVHAVNWHKGAGRYLAYLIAGHHSGLPDWDKAESGDATLQSRLARAGKEKHLDEALGAAIPEDIKVSAFDIAAMSKPLAGC